MNRIGTVVVMLASVSACGKKREAIQEAPLQTVAVPTLGVKIDVPGKASVSDGAGSAAANVAGEEFGGVDLAVLPSTKTPDEAKADLAKKIAIGQGSHELIAPSNVKVEQLPDGFAISYEFTLHKAGGGEAVGQSYGVDVYRTIGGKVVHCFSDAIYERLQATLLAACKSVRA